MPDPKPALPPDRATAPQPDLPDRVQRRQALAGQIAGIALREGLEVLALRGLAERLGTSARMLMYYFGTKEALVEDAIAHLMQRLQAVLAPHSDGPPQSASQFLATVMDMTADPEVAPFMRVLTELIARAARCEAPYDRIANTLVTVWTDWIDSRITAPATPGQAASVLAIVEGITLLEMAAKGSTRAAGPYLIALLEAVDVSRVSSKVGAALK